MKKNLTELVFILDRSGSMAGLEKDTIGGFNAMIEKQKAEVIFRGIVAIAIVSLLWHREAQTARLRVLRSSSA